jgi:hypothetical protein
MRYEIRELGLGGILDQAVKLTKTHFGLFLGIAAVLLIPFYLIQGFVNLAMTAKLPPNPTMQDIIAANQANMANLGFTLPLLLVGAYVVIPITNAALVHAIAGEYLEKPVGVAESLKWALGRILPLIGTWFLVGLAIMGGLILCVIPGVIAAFWFALATQVVVIEGKSGFTAMKRSKELMSGNIGTFFVLGLLVGGINIGLALAVAFIPQPHVQVVATAAIQAIATIFASAATVVFYFSCRCKHEQFDLTLLAQAVGAETPVDAQTDVAQG